MSIVIVGLFVLALIVPTYYHAPVSRGVYSFTACLRTLVMETPFSYLTGIRLNLNPNSCSTEFVLF